MEGKKYLCSFADKRLNLTLKRFGEQAKQMSVYDGVFLYTEEDLRNDFCSHFQDKFKLRGFGYWAWKPQVILQTMDKLQDGDILQYTDAGCHLNPGGLARLNDYFEMTDKSGNGILAFIMGGANEKEWTKGDLFDYFDVRNNKAIFPGQVVSTLLFAKKTKDSMELIKKWLQVFYYDFSLVDDTPSRKLNFDEFKEHRHDQSVWSILVKLNNIPCLSHMEQYNADWKLLRNYPILAKRDKVWAEQLHQILPERNALLPPGKKGRLIRKIRPVIRKAFPFLPYGAPFYPKGDPFYPKDTPFFAVVCGCFDVWGEINKCYRCFVPETMRKKISVCKRFFTASLKFNTRG
jgi:hypothetical protein